MRIEIVDHQQRINGRHKVVRTRVEKHIVAGRWRIEFTATATVQFVDHQQGIDGRYKGIVVDIQRIAQVVPRKRIVIVGDLNCPAAFDIASRRGHNRKRLITIDDSVIDREIVNVVSVALLGIVTVAGTLICVLSLLARVTTSAELRSSLFLRTDAVTAPFFSASAPAGITTDNVS